MTAYLFLLATFAAAWAVVGFSVAVLFLKMRWNLVGGTLLLIVALLPLGGIAAAIMYGQTKQTNFLDLFTQTEAYYRADEAIFCVSLAGLFLGTLVGMASGLIPHAPLEDDQRAAATRWARTWTWWKLLAAPPVAIGLAWALFFLADLSAQGRLKKVQEFHRAQLEMQEAVAPRQLNNASPAHEALLLALMQDPEPDWIEKHNRTFRPGEPGSHGFQFLEEGNLLRVLLPDFEHASSAVKFAQRHEAAYETLKQQVLENGQEYHYWHPKLARFAALRALVHLRDDDLPAAHGDLQLMTHMARQAIDERVGQSHDFIQIETYRFLVFQAMLATTADVPSEVYDTMLADLGDVRLGVRRGLKRAFHEGVVEKIEQLLNEPDFEQAGFRDICRAAAARIVHQHNLDANLESMEHELDTHFSQNAGQLQPLGLFYSNRWDYELVASKFVHETSRVAYFLEAHDLRRDLVRAVRAVQQFHQQQNRYPTQAQFVQLLVTPEWTCRVPLDFVTLHDPASGAEIGAAIAHARHTRVGDGLGFSVGSAARRVVYHADVDTVVRRSATGGTTWIFPPVRNSALQREVPPVP